jgi:hypothetical protein
MKGNNFGGIVNIPIVNKCQQLVYIYYEAVYLSSLVSGFGSEKRSGSDRIRIRNTFMYYVQTLSVLSHQKMS